MAFSPLNNLSTDISSLNRTMSPPRNDSEQGEGQDQLFDPLSYKIMVIAFFSVIFAFGFVGNVSVLGTILKWKRLRNPCGLLIANIALADLGVALIAAPLRIADLYLHGWPFGDVLCRLILPLQDVMVCVSVVTHSTIAFERYRATVTPFKERLSVTKIKFVNVGIWLFCYVFSGLPLAIPLKVQPWKGVLYCFPDWSDLYRRVYEIYLVLVFIVAQLIIQSYTYVTIIRTLNRKSDIRIVEVAEKSETLPSRPSISQPGLTNDSRATCTGISARVKRKQKLVKMLLVLVVAFQICHLPRGITMLYREFVDPSSISPTFNYIDLIALALYYLKHVINPFILFAMSADFRSGIVSICAMCCNRREGYREPDSQKSALKRAEDFNEQLGEDEEVEEEENKV